MRYGEANNLIKSYGLVRVKDIHIELLVKVIGLSRLGRYPEKE